LLKGAAGVMALSSVPAFVHAVGDPKPGSLFTLGVASGDPTARSVVLWTRLAPEPLNGGGLGRRNVVVLIEVALDPAFRHIVRAARRIARAAFGHVINVTVTALPPDTRLYYRFRAMGQTSRVGTTRTFPRAIDSPDQVRFAVVSCQNYNQGFFTAYRDIVAQDVDFVVHTGDYIYEGGPAGVEIAPGRTHIGGETETVEAYRNRYAQYRLDPDLQDAHAAAAFLVTWDDHEVENNYAGRNDENGSDPTDFSERRKNAYRVYRESMPLRPKNKIQRGDSLRIYRTLSFGDLADFHMLDTRQYRTDQSADDGFGSTDDTLSLQDQATLEAVFGEELFDRDGILDPQATLLGRRQEAWLARQLRRSRAHWNVLAQQIMVTQWNLVTTGQLSAQLGSPGPLPDGVQQALDNLTSLWNVDAWDGYVAARQRLFTLIDRIKPKNPVVVTGDIHSSWGANLLSDFDDPTSRIVAAEFVCTSIASTFLALDPRPTDQIVRLGVDADNPHIEYFNGLFRGYALCDLDRDSWTTTYRAVGDINALGSENPLALVPYPNSPVATDAVLRLQNGFRDDNSRLETVYSRLP
jgi:alkaline phosphatase D